MSLLTVVDVACFDRSFYDDTYTELNTADKIGISEADLEKMTDVLLGYLKDDYQTLDVEITFKGEVTQGFNQREIDHMVDVKDLYLNAMMVRNVSFVVFILSLIYLIYSLKKETFKFLLKSLHTVIIGVGAIVLALALFAWIDFDTFWTNFHLIFFDNDLWILNPRVDRLIMMVPSIFFSRLVTKIILGTVLSWFIFYVVLLWRGLKHD